MAGILSAAAEPSRPGRPSRAIVGFLAALGVLWTLIAWPLLVGERTLLARDVFTTHLPAKAWGAAALAAGSIPAFDTSRALGQPYAGNPNVLAFYPGNLLYLVLPFWSAFNAHYLLHWLLAFVGVRGLARALGMSPWASLLSALTFAGSGYLLSLLTFYNLLTVVAWMPFVLWGLARADRRGTLWGGVACGLMLLGGEPITAGLCLPLFLLVAAERHGFRRGLTRCFAVGGIGLVVALPQIVATAGIVGYTIRFAHGLNAAQVGTHSLPVARWLELLLPLPWGWPSNLERFAFWSRFTPITPYIYSVHVGVVAFAVAFAAFRARWRWVCLGAAGLALGSWVGSHPDAALALSGGIFRYSQKFALWTTFAVALLAGWGHDHLFGADRPAGAGRGLRVGAILALGSATLLVVFRHPIRELFVRELGARDASVAATHQTQWFLGALVVAGILGLASFAVRWRRPGLLVVAQALALAQLLPLWTTAPVAEFAPAAPWVERLGRDRAVVLVWSLFPDWTAGASPRAVASETLGWREARLDLDPASGALHGLSYPVATDLDGVFSPLTSLLNERLARSPWPVRERWLRRLGAHWFVRHENDGNPPASTPVATDRRGGVSSELHAVTSPAPAVRWPSRIVVATSPVEALVLDRDGAAREQPLETALVSRAIAHVAGARVELLEKRFDRMRFSVDGGGGIAVVQRSYFPSITATTADGIRLPTQPVELSLLGVEVPPGRQEIEIGSSRRDEKLAGAFAVSVLLAALLVGWRQP